MRQVTHFHVLYFDDSRLLWWKRLSLRTNYLDHTLHTVTNVFRVVQWIFDLSMFDLRKFFDLRKNFTVPKILVHKMFDLSKISKTPFFDLRKKICGFWSKKCNFWFRNSQILPTLIFATIHKQLTQHWMKKILYIIEIL